MRNSDLSQGNAELLEIQRIAIRAVTRVRCALALYW